MSKKTADQEFLGIQRYQVEIKGITELKVHKRPNEVDLEPPWKGLTPPNKQQLAWAVSKAEFKDEKGLFYIPAGYIQSCLERAGVGKKIPGKNKETFRSVISQGGLVIEPDQLYFPEQKATEVVWWATTNKEGNQIYAVARQFWPWSLSFTIVVTRPEYLTEEYIRHLLEYAGLYSGLGVGRPARGGKFGKFKIIAFKQV